MTEKKYATIMFGPFVAMALIVTMVASCESRSQRTARENANSTVRGMSSGIKHYTLSNGLECVTFDSDSYAGGIDCNWEGYNDSRNTGSDPVGDADSDSVPRNNESDR